MNDLFTKGFEALSKNSSKYLGFMLNNKGAFAKLADNDKSRVQNAYICIQKGKTPTIWEIENGAPKTIPASLCLWFKNHKKLGLCIQSTEDNESYIFFGDEETPFPSDCMILVIIENEDWGLCLYVDSDSQQILWLHEYKEGSQSVLVELMGRILNLKKKETDENDLSEINSKFF